MSYNSKQAIVPGGPLSNIVRPNVLRGDSANVNVTRATDMRRHRLTLVSSLLSQCNIVTTPLISGRQVTKKFSTLCPMLGQVRRRNALIQNVFIGNFNTTRFTRQSAISTLHDSAR